MKKFFGMSVTMQIVVAMILGALLGFILNNISVAESESLAFVSDIKDFLVNGVFTVIGQVFVKLLKMLVVPIVFVSLVCGVCSLKDIHQLGRLGFKTLVLYLLTTALAITIALIFANFVNPGEGFNLTTDVTFKGKDAPPLSEVFVNMIPDNPIASMAQGKMLQIITFAILFGLAMATLGSKVEKIKDLFELVNEILMKLITIMMLVAPIGVFCLIAIVFAKQGFDAIRNLMSYFSLVVIVLLIHGFVTYPVLLKLFSGLNPLQFFKNIKEVLAFGFSTASSSATIPVTLDAVEHKMGVKNSIASFTVPLGATINMDGTAIMQGCATVFIAQAYGIDISFQGYLMVILTATLASVGTAGVPGVGLITLAMVLKQVNLPEEGIGLIIGVDRLLDMLRTSVNIAGDAMVSCVVAKSEGGLRQDVFDADVSVPHVNS